MAWRRRPSSATPVLGFRARGPEVESWIVANETNHVRSLSTKDRGRVARFVDVVARHRVDCRLVGPNALDVSGMTASVRAFQRHARERPHIWGLHNDVWQTPNVSDLELPLGRFARPGAPGP
jgi:hypothetical protein